MRAPPLLLLSLAACGGSSKPTLGNIAGSGGPPGPAPTIAWSGEVPGEGGNFEITGMPAVSDDGGQVLYGWQRGDGGRGYPNLELVIVDRADRSVERRVVLDADKIDGGNAQPVDVTAHNQYLADRNALARWRPLASAPVESEDEDEDDSMYPTKQTATLGEVGIRFDDTAHVVIEQGGKVVVDKTMKDWLLLERPMYEGAAADETCTNDIYLSSAYVDGARRIALIGFDYHGTDSCWEPTGEYHVLAW